MRRLLPALLLMIAAACSGGDSDDTTTTTLPPPSTIAAPAATNAPTTVAPTTTTTTSTTSTTTTTVPRADVWPLTGEDGYEEGAPILFVKIDNTSRGRPQEGLDKADLVFEIMVEGGVSRLLAAFQSEVPEVVGPVRSTRETDAKILYPFAPYFSNSGGQSFVREMVNDVSRDVSHARLGGLYFRARGRPSVYDLMLEAQFALERVNPLPRENAVFLDFGTPGTEGEPATQVAASMSNSQISNWSWDADQQRYLRSNNNTPHEAASGEQIAAANVLALEVEQFLLARTDSAGSRVPDYRLVGSGPATLFRDGLAYPGTWERDNLNSWFRFLDADGLPMQFAVGPTWIEMVPAGRSVNWA